MLKVASLVFKVEIDDKTTAELIQLGTMLGSFVGDAIALYGRWKATEKVTKLV